MPVNLSNNALRTPGSYLVFPQGTNRRDVHMQGKKSCVHQMRALH